MQVTVDHELCIGCGACEDECPEVFSVGEDGLSRVINSDIDPRLFGAVRNAEDFCPVSAISITE